MKKKLLAFAIMLVMASGILYSVMTSAEALSVRLDGNVVTMDAEPFIDANGRTMVPVRFVGEALAAAVDWDANTRTVTITKDATLIKLVVGSQIITVNGAATTMDTAAVIRYERTFVPVRYIAEALGLDVGWDGTTSTVLLTAGGTSIILTPSSGANLVNAMSDAEYQNLNKYFDPFCMFTRLKDITNDTKVVNFGVWWYQDGMAKFSIPKERVEEVVGNYFGVERINHEALTGNDPFKIPVYKNGFYGSGDGVGWNLWDWCNVSEMIDNGDGTFTATVNLFECSGEYVDGRGVVTRYIEAPENRYSHIALWNLQDGQSIVDGGEAWRNVNIHRIATDVVTLRPNGDSWQIVSINGWKIPKTLFADYVAQTKELNSVNTNYLAMVGKSLADIKTQLGDVQAEFEFHAEYYVTTPGSGVYYYFQGDDGILSGTGEWAMNDTDVCTKVASKLGNIVSGVTVQTTIADFTENLLTATKYEMRDSGGTSYYVAAEKYAVVFLNNGRVLEINMDDAGDKVSPDSYAWLR